MRYIITFGLATLIATPALSQVPRVFTDIVPVQSLVASVMGDLGEPQILLPQGADPHDFQLRPSQARELGDADLIVRIGPALTPWLDRAMDGIGIAGQVMTLMDLSATRPYDSHESDEDHTETADDHGHDDDAHDDHGDTDPHVWLDPDNAKTWLALIATELSRLDPSNAASYSQNATLTAQRITALDAEIGANLASSQGRPFMVFHNAYGYFADHYGLTIAGTIRQGDASTPGARHLAELRDKAQSGQAICLFPEAGHDPEQAQHIAAGTNLRLGPALDPEGALLESGPLAYDALMRALATAITGCLTAVP
jgi:zinc transport system substrate-binding protein